MFDQLLIFIKKLIYIPCFASLGGFLLMLIMATMTLVQAIKSLPAIFLAHFDYNLTKSAIVMAIFAVDQYLIAFLFYIFSAGVYSLFLHDQKSSAYLKRSLLKIQSLDQLKDTLSKTIILALLIEYFKFAIEMSYTTSSDLFYLALSILAASLSVVALFHFSRKK